MMESFRRNKKGIALILVASLFSCCGQFLWKLSAGDNGFLWLVLGYGCYGLGMLFMLVAYKFGSLSVLQPMMSMNFVLSLVLAAVFLGEPVNVMRTLGVFIILGGIVLIGGGDD